MTATAGTSFRYVPDDDAWTQLAAASGSHVWVDSVHGFVQRTAATLITARNDDDFHALAAVASGELITVIAHVDAAINASNDPSLPGGKSLAVVDEVHSSPIGMPFPNTMKVRVSYFGATTGDGQRRLLWREAWTVNVPTVAVTTVPACAACGAPNPADSHSRCRYCGTVIAVTGDWHLVDIRGC